MCVALCILFEANIFGVRAVFNMDACHIFPLCVLVIIPLMGGCRCAAPCALGKTGTGVLLGPGTLSGSSGGAPRKGGAVTLACQWDPQWRQWAGSACGV